MSKRRGLGRNLDALLGGISTPTGEETKATAPPVAIDVSVEDTSPASSKAGPAIASLPIEVMQRGKYQPRFIMDEEQLEALSASIKVHGIIQPIVVRPIDDKRYEIIAGERRWRAAQLAGLDKVPVVIRHFNDEEASIVALIENLQREDLNPVEEATGLQRLIDEFDLTHQQLADTLGRGRTSITNMLRLLSLNSDARKLLENGDIEMGHARALLGLSTDKQSEIAHRVVSQMLSVRDTEQLVKSLQNPQAPAVKSRLQDPDVKRLQEKLSDCLAASVMIDHGNRGKGKVSIKYNSLDELDGIIEKIQGKHTHD